MDRPRHPASPELRISDPERQNAINILGSHFAEGRLTLDEFEERCTLASSAITHGELDGLFHDLPRLSPGAHLMPMYSAAEVERAHRDGARPKAAIVGLTAIATGAAGIMLHPLWQASAVLMLIVPVVAILLYVAKIGPEHWHVPSQQSMERRRLKALRAEQRMEIEQRKAIRRNQRAEITDTAMHFASQAINKRINRR